MADEIDIALPVRFNPFKHHRNYLLSVLEDTAPEDIVSLLDPLCNNYIDIYTGTMMPQIVVNSVINILKSNHVFQFDDFLDWIASKNGYQQIKLEDQSEWIVQKGIEPERYIHIHPAWKCSFTIRFKGSTLKTIYLLKTSFKGSADTLSLERVNHTRMRIGLSSMKNLDLNKGILKCYEDFFNPAIMQIHA